MDSFDVFSQMKEDGLDTETLTFVTEDEVDLAVSLGMQYIVKPFTIHDLMNRISNISFRSERIQRPIIQKLGRITMDVRRAIVSKDDNPIELSLHDYDLFCFLASQPGTVFNREGLMKIEDTPNNPQIIMTRRGAGYYFETS